MSSQSAVTVAASNAPMTASALVREGDCSPQCLISAGTEATSCGCPCRGQHHGKLASVQVPGTLRPLPPERIEEPALFAVEGRSA